MPGAGGGARGSRGVWFLLLPSSQPPLLQPPDLLAASGARQAVCRGCFLFPVIVPSLAPVVTDLEVPLLLSCLLAVFVYHRLSVPAVTCRLRSAGRPEAPFPCPWTSRPELCCVEAEDKAFSAPVHGQVPES